jgi:hypothetical protein
LDNDPNYLLFYIPLDPSERPVKEAVLWPIIGSISFAITIAVIVVLIIRKKRQKEPSNKRNIHEIEIEERQPYVLLGIYITKDVDAVFSIALISCTKI